MDRTSPQKLSVFNQSFHHRTETISGYQRIYWIERVTLSFDFHRNSVIHQSGLINAPLSSDGRGQYIPTALDSGISSTNIDLRPPNSPVTDTNPWTMTLVSNDPMYWPTISYFRQFSYFTVTSLIVVLYDWGA
jgi:hypothetical protein